MAPIIPWNHRELRSGVTMDASRREAQVRSFIEAVWNSKNYDAVA